MAIPAPAVNAPNGCMTGFSKDIALAIGRSGYGKKKTQFLTEMLVQSFGNAGRQQGEDAGLRFFFDLPTMCKALDCSKQSIARIRRELEADHVLTYTANQHDYATGWLVWNTDTTSWTPAQHGGARTGAGNPQWRQATVNHLKAEERETSNRKPLESKSEEEALSRGLRLVGKTPIKRFTLPSLEAAPVQAAIVESKKGTEEEYTEEYVSANATHIKQGELLPITPKERTPKSASGSKKGYIFDALYYKAVEIFGKPLGGEKHYWLKTVLPELREDGITPEQLDQAAKTYKERCKGYTFSMKAIFNNLSTLLQPQAAPAKQEKPVTLAGGYFRVEPTVSWFPQGGY